MFLSALESMGLTVQPEGKVLKIIESNRARESAIPIYGGDNDPPTQDQFVTRLLRLEHVSPRRREGRARSLEEPRRRHHRLRADQHAGHHRPGDQHPAHGRRGQAARRADGRREDLGHQAAHRVGERHGVDAVEHLQRLQGRQRRRRAARRPNLARAAGAGRPRWARGRRDRICRCRRSSPTIGRTSLVVVSTEKAYQRILALVKRLDQMSARAGDSATDLVHVVPLENANAEDIAGTLGGLGAAREPRRQLDLRRAAGRAADRPRPRRRRQDRAVRGRRAHLVGQADQLARHPRQRARLHHGARAHQEARHAAAAGVRRGDDPRDLRSTRRASSASAWHGGTTLQTGNDQSLLFGGSEPSSDVNSILFSPAALSGLAAGLRGPAIPGADKILGLPPGTSVPSFGVFVQALQNNGDVNVVSMPHVLTTDNEKATIQVGQNLPFPGSLGGFPDGGRARRHRHRLAAGRDLRLRHLGAAPGRGAQAGDHAARQRLRFRATGDRQRDYPTCRTRTSTASARRPASARSRSVVTVRDQQSIVLGGLIKDSVSRNGEQGSAARRHPDSRLSLQVHQQDGHQAEPAHHPDAVHHQGSERPAPHLRAQDPRAARVHGALLGVPRRQGLRGGGRLPAQARPARGDQPDGARSRAKRRSSCATPSTMLGRDMSGEVTIEPPPPAPLATPGGTVGAPPAPERTLPPPPRAPRAHRDDHDHEEPMQYEDEAITAVRATGEMPATGAHPRALGQILLRQSPLTEQQLDDGAARAARGGRAHRRDPGAAQLRHRGADAAGAGGAARSADASPSSSPRTCDAELATRVPINFASQHRLMPIRRDGRGVEVAVADPLDVHALDDVRARARRRDRAGGGAVGARSSTPSTRSTRGRRAAASISGEGEDEMDGRGRGAHRHPRLTDEAPIIRWVNSLMFHAVKERASDIHIEPREKELIVRYRIDGELDRGQARQPQLHELDPVAREDHGRPQHRREAPAAGRPHPPQDRRQGHRHARRHRARRSTASASPCVSSIDRACSSTWPTSASARTTSSSSTSSSTARTASSWSPAPPAPARRRRSTPAWRKINTPDLNILTVEDPVEYQLEGITQVPVNPKIELTFASALRSFLRHDPDVIMVGEIRDRETAEIAIQASLTGHLVFSTIHTNDAAGAITRLVDMGDRAVPRRLVADRAARAAPGAPPVPRVPRALSADRRGAAQARHRPGDVLRRLDARAADPLQVHAAAQGHALPGARRRLPALLQVGLPRPNRHLRAAADGQRDPPAGAQEHRLQHDQADAPSPRACARCATTARPRCCRGSPPSKRS